MFRPEQSSLFLQPLINGVPGYGVSNPKIGSTGGHVSISELIADAIPGRSSLHPHDKGGDCIDVAFCQTRQYSQIFFRSIELLARALQALGIYGLESDKDEATATGGNDLMSSSSFNRFAVI